jgi:uncharacterized protein (TIGR00296 family)
MESLIVQAEPDHCKFCFEYLLWHFSRGKKPKVPNSSISVALFITWNSKATGELRGCIGTLKPKLLSKSLGQYTLHSATQDKRFNPITLEELHDLQVTVSFLHSFEQVQEWNDWKIGVHGIEIEVFEDSLLKKATFLPGVAEEQQWNHKQTLMELMRKAGCKRVDLNSLVKVVRYQCSKCTLSYSESGLLASGKEF